MANSLEFSRFGDPIEGRYDAYGEFLADSLPEDPGTTREDQDRITRKIDEAPALHSSEIEPYDPFGDMEAWGKAYESLDDDCEEGEGE